MTRQSALVVMFSVVISLLGCDAKSPPPQGAVKAEGESPDAQRQHDELLTAMAELEPTVTLHAKDVPLAEVLEDMNAQVEGAEREVSISSMWKSQELIDRRVTVDLAKAPFWLAVAELAVQSDTGFHTPDGVVCDGRKVTLDPTRRLLRPFEVAGPVLIGVMSEQLPGKPAATNLAPGEVGHLAPAPREKSFILTVYGQEGRFEVIGDPTARFAASNGESLGKVKFGPADDRWAQRDYRFTVPEGIWRANPSISIVGSVRIAGAVDLMPLSVPLVDGHTGEQFGFTVTVATDADNELDFHITLVPARVEGEADGRQDPGSEETWCCVADVRSFAANGEPLSPRQSWQGTGTGIAKGRISAGATFDSLPKEGGVLQLTLARLRPFTVDFAIPLKQTSE